MPKGSKICPSCKHQCGPRSFVCTKCGSPFTFKGGVKPSEADIKLSIQRANEKKGIIIESKEDEVKYLRDIREYFQPCTPTNRERILFGANVNTYESKCGKYRVRSFSSFMGVPAKEIAGDSEAHESTPYFQLCKYQPKNMLALVKKFSDSSDLVNYHESVIKGEKEEVLFKPENERRTRGEKALRKRLRKKGKR